MNNSYHITEVKKSLFGTTLIGVDDLGNKFTKKLPKSSAFKAVQTEKGFVFTRNGEVVTPELNSVWVNGNTYTCETVSDTKIKLDVELGNITPEYKFENGNLLVDVNGVIFAINTRFDTTRADALAELDGNDAVFIDDNVLCKNPDGTYQLIDSKLNIILPENAENTDIKVEYSDANGNKVYKYNNKQFLCYANGKYKEFSIDYKFYPIQTNVPGQIGICAYNSDKNSSTNIIIDIVTNEKFRENFIENVVKEVYFIKDSQPLYVTKSLNNKVGVVDEFGNEVIPHSFDNVAFEQLKNNGEVVVKVDSANQVGVYSTNGTELVEVKFDDINLQESDKVGEVYKFVANQDGLWGVTNSKGVTEVKFEYKLDTANGRELHAYQETTDGREVEYLQMVDIQNNPVLLNVSEQNMLATAEGGRQAETTVDIEVPPAIEDDVMAISEE